MSQRGVTRLILSMYEVSAERLMLLVCCWCAAGMRQHTAIFSLLCLQADENGDAAETIMEWHNIQWINSTSYAGLVLLSAALKEASCMQLAAQKPWARLLQRS
jgi:hypothetical protein